jgi:8-oxo-dGTP diphosphatase
VRGLHRWLHSGRDRPGATAALEGGTMSDFHFSHEEVSNGGIKYPRKATLRAHHPDGSVAGEVKYFPPKRKRSPLTIDAMTPAWGRARGAASALMDEMERRHPGSRILHMDEIAEKNKPKPGDPGFNANRDYGLPTDWDTHFPALPDAIHRGMGVRLDKHDAQDIHDPNMAAKDQVRVLRRAVETGGPGGMHWSADEKTSHMFAYRNAIDPRTDIPVILHARTPARKDIEVEPHILRNKGVWPHDHNAGDAEVPIRKRRKVTITGMSWLPDVEHPEADEEGWVHHTFDEPLVHHASADDTSYRMEHRPPDTDFGAPHHDLTQILPDNVYTHPQYYDPNGQGGDWQDRKTFQDSYHQIQRTRDKPEAKVRIYRALPAEYAGQGFRSGDWVTTSRDYAIGHGKHHSDSKHDWPVISTTVPAKHLQTSGDDLREWGYTGPHKKWPGVSYKGGYHQEIRQRADGTVAPVKRRTPKTEGSLTPIILGDTLGEDTERGRGARHGGYANGRRVAGRGKPRSNGSPRGSGAGADAQGAPGVGGEADGLGAGQAGPRSVELHPGAAKDLSKLDKPVQKQIGAVIDQLAAGGPTQTHALTGPLKGWSATKASRGHRITHRNTDEGSIHIGHIGLHNYDEAIRRLTSRERHPHDLAAQWGQQEARKKHPELTEPLPPTEHAASRRLRDLLGQLGHPQADQAFVIRHDNPGRGASQVVMDEDTGDPGVALHPERWDQGTLAHEAAHIMHAHADGRPLMELLDREHHHGPEFAEHYRKAISTFAPEASDHFMNRYHLARRMLRDDPNAIQRKAIHEELSYAEHRDGHVLLHRGVGEHDGKTWDGKPYATAEDWHRDAREDRPGYGRWWGADEDMAKFYGDAGHSGMVVSAWFPKHVIRDSDNYSGVIIPNGTEGRVHRVQVKNGRGESDWKDLPHTPGMKITSARIPINSWDDYDKFVEQHYGPNAGESGRREKHPRSGFTVNVGEHRQVARPPKGQEEGPAVWNITDHGELPNLPMLPQRNIRQEPIEHVYRGVSTDEWKQAQERGYLKSDQRGTIADWEGTNAATDPKSAMSYLPHNGGGHVLKIRVHPDEKWFTIPHDQYARTRERIPLDRVEHVSPLIHKDDKIGLSYEAGARGDLPQDLRIKQGEDHIATGTPDKTRTVGVQAYVGGQNVGHLYWHTHFRPGQYRPGEISSVWVHDDHQRRGIASAMLEHAKSIEPRVHHSHALTGEGRSWSTAARALPSDRIFGPTYGLDHRLFDGTRLKPQVRQAVMERLDKILSDTAGLTGWQRYTRVYLAGSEASEWTSPSLEGNSDFDTLLGVDYDKAREVTSSFLDRTDSEIDDILNDVLRTFFNDEDWLAPFGGVWHLTGYCNHDALDVRDIKPYAAYDISQDRWSVKPPHLPDWGPESFPQGQALWDEIEAVTDYIEAIERLPEPFRAQQGAALYDHLHNDRHRAFGPDGEGWYDNGNVIEKALDQSGHWARLLKIKKDHLQGLHLKMAAASQPFPNPYHGDEDRKGARPEWGHTWFHGIREENPDLNGTWEHREEDRPGNGHGGPQTNKLLGRHFSSLHSVSHGFANHTSERTAIAHAELHFKNPAHYDSEDHLNRHLFRWARDNWPGFHNEKMNDDQAWAGRFTSHELIEHEAKKPTGDEDQDRRHKSRLRSGIESFLQWHPDQPEIVRGFVQHLHDQGHHGITYGNQVEGPGFHVSAISTHPSQIKTTHVEHIAPGGAGEKRWDGIEIPAQKAHEVSWERSGLNNESNGFLRQISMENTGKPETTWSGNITPPRRPGYRYQAVKTAAAPLNIRRGISLSPDEGWHPEAAERILAGKARPEDLIKHIDTNRVGHYWYHPRDFDLEDAQEFALHDDEHLKQWHDYGDELKHENGNYRGSVGVAMEAHHHGYWDPNDNPEEPNLMGNSYLPGHSHMKLHTLHYSPDWGDTWHTIKLSPHVDIHTDGPGKTAGANGDLPADLTYKHSLDKGIHTLFARHPEMPGDAHFAGVIGWWDKDGEVGGIEVHPQMQRRGLATELYRRAKEITPHLHHSEYLSPDAKQWISGMDGKTAKLDLPPEQQAAFEEPDFIKHRRMILDVAKRPLPGLHIWRGEVRHEDPSTAAAAGVGMHWTANPDAILHPIPEPGQHNIVWHGVLEDPQEQTLSRDHPIWHGRHYSEDSEAEVRLRHGSRVKLRGAYVWHPEDEFDRPGTLVPRFPERNNLKWTYHPLDTSAEIAHKPVSDTIDYSDVGIHRLAHGDNDTWVHCDQGHEHWGAEGAAGMLIRHHGDDGKTRYLLQKRAPWVDHGNTWGIPGGAIDSGESPEAAAHRETEEEMGELPRLKHSHTVTDDHGGGWAYHTVVADSPHRFTPEGGGEDEDEHAGHGWFTHGEMNELPLHPGFRKSWDRVRTSHPGNVKQAMNAEEAAHNHARAYVDWQLERPHDEMEEEDEAPHWLHDAMNERNDDFDAKWHRMHPDEHDSVHRHLDGLSHQKLIIGTTRVHDILKTGRMKTLAEPGTNSHYDDDYINDRHAYERHVMGVPEDLPLHQRPIYGSMHNDPKKNHYAEHQFELRPHVRSRTTVTMGDSMNHILRNYPINHVPHLEHEHVRAMIDPRELERLGWGNEPNSYMEFQVHGGVSLKDIAKLHLHGDRVTGELSPEAQAMAAHARAKGLEVVHHRPNVLDEISPEYHHLLKTKGGKAVRLDLGRGRYAEWHPGMTSRDMITVVGPDGVSQMSWGALVALSNGEILEQLPEEGLDKEAALTDALEFKTRSGKRKGIHHTMISAHDGSEKVGHVRMIEGGTEVDDLHVRPERRGEGIGHALMDEAIDQFGHNTLRLHASPFGSGGLEQGPLMDFYASHGFEPEEGRGPGYMIRHPGRTTVEGKTAMPSKYKTRPENFKSYSVPAEGQERNQMEAKYPGWDHHVLHGYHDDSHAGQVSYSTNPEETALGVHMLETSEGHEGKGIGSALMDDLLAGHPDHYVNHGSRTGHGKGWWSQYDDPAPHKNVDNLPIEEWGPHFGIEPEKEERDPHKMWGSAAVRLSPENHAFVTKHYFQNHEAAKRVLKAVGDNIEWHKDVDDPSDSYHAMRAAEGKAEALHEPGAHPVMRVTVHTTNGKTIAGVGVRPHVPYEDLPSGFNNNMKYLKLGRPVRHPSLSKDAATRTVPTNGGNGDISDSMMVAFVPPASVAEGLALDDEAGLRAEELHITLLYVGKTERFTDKQLSQLPVLVQQWAKTQQPLQARTQGAGTFVNEGNHVMWASVDIPGASRAHDSLADFLRGHGIEINEDHGFVPHMTLKYDRYHVRFLPKVHPESWTVDEVWWCRAGEWVSYRLGR